MTMICTNEYCVERERKLRKEPIPTRPRYDNSWELFVRNFPCDTTEVVFLQLQHSIFTGFFCSDTRYLLEKYYC